MPTRLSHAITRRSGGHWFVLLTAAAVSAMAIPSLPSALAAPSGTPTGAADAAVTGWPQFRGPGGQGVSPAHGLPTTWSEKENVTWKTPIHGRAWSSPVVLGDQIWMTTATEDGRQLFAVCVDKASGKIVFDLKLFDVQTPQFAHAFNTYASPTPVAEPAFEGHPARVFVTFGSPGTACLDAASGRLLWERRDFVCNHFRGAGSSPLLYNNKLIMNFDGSDHQFVVALDAASGKTLWQTDRSVDYQDQGPDGKPRNDGDFRKAFSTPRIGTFAGADGGRPMLFSLGSKAFYAYDPETGKELWRIENRVAHSGSATPLMGKDLVYFQTGHGKPELWAVRPSGSGVLSNSDIVFKVVKNVPTRGSPVLVDDLLYMVDDGGVATCTDATNGTVYWHNRIEGSYSAAPVFADGHIYFFSEKGKATAIEPGREFKVVGESTLDDGFMAAAAIADNAFFLRTKTALYRIEKK